MGPKRQKRVLMCRPDNYGVEYEINPWMDKRRQPDKKVAMAQWEALRSSLEEADFWVSVLKTPITGFPDMGFTANAGLVYNRTILLSRFRHEERRGEIAAFRNWFLTAGYDFNTLPAGVFFEGEGDALWAGDKLVCGFGDFRTNELGARLAGEFVGEEPILLKLVNPRFYHLDTCFCYLKKDLIMCYLPAFDDESVEKMEKIGEILPVSEYDAKRFVCNGVVAEKPNQFRILITTPASRLLRTRLENYGIGIMENDLFEFIKAGGAAKCLTLFI